MGEATQDRARIRALLASAGLRPDKSFGQNFLADPNIIRKIAHDADIDGRQVVEIGAGTGALTAALAARAVMVVAYEVDESLAPVLDQTVAAIPNVDLRWADAAAVDLDRDLGDGRWVMVANLPYNVGTRIVLDALRSAPRIDRFVVMVQREVGERMLAEPGSKTYGLPSVVVGLHATGRMAMTVPPQVFEPPPRVESVVVHLDRLPAPAEAEAAIAIAAAAFNQRRKMLRRSLATVLDDPEATLEAAGVDPTARPEQLAPVDYVAIARVGGGE